MRRRRTVAPVEASSGGVVVVDDRGRLALPGAVRRALGLDAGASVAWIALGGTVLLVPQDQHLSALFARAQVALSTAGLSVEDVVAELPTARAEVAEETYGPEFVQEVARAYADARRSDPTE